MIRTIRLIRFALIAIITLLFSCSEDEIIGHGNNTANGKTSLFEEVTEPEYSDPTNSLGGRETYSDASYSGLASGGSTITSDSGGGNPNGQFEPGVLTAGEWNDLSN